MIKIRNHGPGARAGANMVIREAPVAPEAIKAPAPRPVNLERVRALAYELFLERARTGEPGDEVSDWARAERQLSNGRGNNRRGDALLQDPE